MFQKVLASQFFRGEEGQDLVEYALLMAFISVAAVTVLLAIGGDVAALWAAADKKLTGGK